VSDDHEMKHVLRTIPADTGVPTQVDIRSLEGAVPWLEGLKQYVHDHLIKQMGVLTLTKNRGDLYFGGVDSASLVYNKHNAYVKAIIDSYHSVIESLDIAAEATKSIAKNYRDAEHNNALNVAAVEKAFAAGSDGGGTATTGSTGTSATSGTI
jgi:hypothetical protein